MCQKFLWFLDFVAYEFVLPRKKIDSHAIKDALRTTDAESEIHLKWSQMLGRTLSSTGSIPKPLGNLM